MKPRLINQTLLLAAVSSQLTLKAETHDWFLRQNSQGLQATNVIEFPNLNTFVKAPSTKGEDVRIHLPQDLTADSLVESLFLVYSARHSMAKSIVVDLEGSPKVKGSALSEGMILDFFAQAGAFELCHQGVCHSLVRRQFPRMAPPTNSIYTLARPSIAAKMPGEQITWPVSNLAKVKGALVSVDLDGTDNQTLLKTLGQVEAFTKAGAWVHVIAPYLPYARSDKAERDIGVTVQARLVADLLQLAGAQAMTVVRPHAPQSVGYYDIPVIAVSGRETINAYLKDLGVEAIIAPDAGFQKDASKYAQELGLPLHIFQKERNSSGEASLIGSDLGGIDGKVLALIDDETASGGTLAMVAHSLKLAGAAKIFAVVTHLAGDGKQATASEDIDMMVVTNTLENFGGKAREKLRILDVTTELVARICEELPFPKSVRVAVASTQEQKVRAARAFASKVFGIQASVEGLSVESGVAKQPIGQEEGVLGAQNRLNALSGKSYAVKLAVENFIDGEKESHYDQAAILVSGQKSQTASVAFSQKVRVPEQFVNNLSLDETVGERISATYAAKGIDLSPNNWHVDKDFAGRERAELIEEGIFHAYYASAIKEVKDKIKYYPDFPMQGILFEDLTPVMADGKAFNAIIDMMVDRYRHQQIDVVVGLDARGFIWGAALARGLNVGFVPVRKKGKLPGDVDRVEYQKEYGADTLELTKGTVQPGKRVIVMDDLIATGGSARAAITLVENAGGIVVEFSSMLEIAPLEGRKALGVPSFNLISKS